MIYLLRRRAARVLVLGFLTGCNLSSPLVEYTFPRQRWAYPDTLSVSWQEAGGCRELHLALQMTPKYPFRNLWLKFYFFSDGKPLSESLAEFLFEDAYGNPYNRTYRFERLLVRWEKLPKGTYVLNVLPFTRQDTIEGIRFIRLWIKPCDL